MDKLAIGKVRTSVGVKGYFKVLSFSDEFNHFKKLKDTTIELRQSGRSLNSEVEDVRMSGSNLTMKLKGIETPEEAKKLSGWELYVERDRAVQLNDGEFYIGDLCSCRLFFGGEPVGRITAVTSNGVSDLLEVELDGKTRLIPFMEQYVGDVDVAGGRVELIEGWLLE